MQVMHKALLLVGVGGFFGAIARFTLGTAIASRLAVAHFPVGTFTVNLLGCVAIGLCYALAERYGLLGDDTRLFLVTGFLGSFTTFSAFGLETVLLLRTAHYGIAVSNVLLSIFGGIAGVWLGARW